MGRGSLQQQTRLSSGQRVGEGQIPMPRWAIAAAHWLQPDRGAPGSHPQLTPCRPPTACPPPGGGPSSEPALGEATASNLVAVKRKRVHRLMAMSSLSSSSKSKEHKKGSGSLGERQIETEEVEERDKEFRRLVAGPSLSTQSLNAHCTPCTS